MKFIYIGIFGILGVFLRYLFGVIVSVYLPSSFPFGTMMINALGAFMAGVVYVISIDKMRLSADIRLGILVGLLGGFTTFSTYCLEVFKLAEDGNRIRALLYWSLSPIFGILAVIMGAWLTRYILIK